MNELNFFMAHMPNSRMADYIVGCLDSSVYIDFNKDKKDKICIKRISFDGYGCCEPKQRFFSTKKFKSMSQKDSLEFEKIFENKVLDQQKLTKIIR